MFQFINISIDPKLQSLGSTPSWDTFLVLLFAFSVITYAFFVSRERLVVVLLSVYSALAIVEHTPLIANALKTFPNSELFKYELGAFVALFLILYLLFAQNMSLRAEIGHSWWQASVLSFLQVGLFITSLLSFIPSFYLSASTLATTYFTGDLARSLWMLAPIAAMVIMRKKSSGPPGSLS
jgi:hypothetical protein